MLTELVPVPAGSFRMGSTSFYPEEAPIHTATVGAFGIERHPVTNAQFAEFVDATGYVTVAERPLDPALYPGVAEADLLPGALVFRPTAGPVDLRDWRQWWDWAGGANWRHPFGQGSDVAGRDDHPVVQVAFQVTRPEEQAMPDIDRLVGSEERAVAEVEPGDVVSADFGALGRIGVRISDDG